MDWFRSWHGAPTDNKWLVIAKRANVAPGMVSAVAWALLDYASQNSERGSVDGFDVETYAMFTGWDESQIEAVIDAMRSKGVITEDGRLSAWEKRQPKREDPDNVDRVRKHRDAKRNALQKSDSDVTDDATHSNAVKRNVTQSNDRSDKSRTEHSRQEQIRASSTNANGQSHDDDDLIDPEVTEAISKWQSVFAGTPHAIKPPVEKFHRWLAFGGPDVLCHMIEQAKGKDNPTGYLYTTYDNWRKDGEVAPHVSKLVAGKRKPTSAPITHIINPITGLPEAIAA